MHVVRNCYLLMLQLFVFNIILLLGILDVFPIVPTYHMSEKVTRLRLHSTKLYQRFEVKNVRCGRILDFGWKEQKRDVERERERENSNQSGSKLSNLLIVQEKN